MAGGGGGELLEFVTDLRRVSPPDGGFQNQGSLFGLVAMRKNIAY